MLSVQQSVISWYLSVRRKQFLLCCPRVHCKGKWVLKQCLAPPALPPSPRLPRHHLGHLLMRVLLTLRSWDSSVSSLQGQATTCIDRFESEYIGSDTIYRLFF